MEVNWKYYSMYLRTEIKKTMKSEVDQLGLWKADIYMRSLLISISSLRM